MTMRRKTPAATKFKLNALYSQYAKKVREKKARKDEASSQIMGVIHNYSTTNLQVISSLSIELI